MQCCSPHRECERQKGSSSRGRSSSLTLLKSCQIGQAGIRENWISCGGVPPHKPRQCCIHRSGFENALKIALVAFLKEFSHQASITVDLGQERLDFKQSVTKISWYSQYVLLQSREPTQTRFLCNHARRHFPASSWAPDNFPPRFNTEKVLNSTAFCVEVVLPIWESTPCLAASVRG